MAETTCYFRVIGDDREAVRAGLDVLRAGVETMGGICLAKTARCVHSTWIAEATVSVEVRPGLVSADEIAAAWHGKPTAAE